MNSSEPEPEIVKAIRETLNNACEMAYQAFGDLIPYNLHQQHSTSTIQAIWST